MDYLRVTMLDGTKYDIPVDVIARDRAEYYAHEFDGDVERSLKEDTLPAFEADPYEIKDWAANNMNWVDVAEHAQKVRVEAPGVDFQEGWLNGEKEIISK